MTDIVRIFAPLLVWLALFSGVYGLHGIGCGLGWPDLRLDGLSLHRLALLSAFGASLAVQAALLFALARPFRSGHSFVQGVTLTLAVTALLATGWTLFPVIFASSCP
jgi:hypothetical protein